MNQEADIGLDHQLKVCHVLSRATYCARMVTVSNRHINFYERTSTLRRQTANTDHLEIRKWQL
jgi:hypothetical protein